MTNHTERLFPSEKACNEAGLDLTANVQYPNNLHATYLCLPQSVFATQDPPKKGKRFGVF